MWSTGERNGKPLQYSCLENPMNSMKRVRIIKSLSVNTKGVFKKANNPYLPGSLRFDSRRD